MEIHSNCRKQGKRKEDARELKASNANKVISVLLSVAMCPMMVPSAAFAADDDAASDASSPIEQAQSADQAEASGTSASSSDTIAPQSESADASTGEAAPAATANGEGAEAPTAEEGTEAAVAEVNGVSYPSLQAAIDAASRNATVKLLADTTENVTISTSDVTLDLNGYTLNGGTVAGKPALTVTARVTVKDSSETQTGTIKREDTAENSGVSSHYVIDIQGAGWLTFESGNVTNNSGTTSGKGASLVRVGDDSVAKYPGLNIKGGNFTQNNFIVIKVDRGDLFLNGGTLNSTNSYAIEDWHRATIKGGTVNGAVAAWTYAGGLNSDLSISGGTVNGNVISVNYGSAEGKVAKVSITGGTVNGTLGTYTYNNGLAATTDAAKATIKITGGTFSNDPAKYVVEDSAINKNADGTYGVAKAYLAQVGETSYYTMGEAFDAQTASGEAITLLRDYTTGSTFNSGTVARVVDLNGHTWTCTGTDANSAAFEINNPNASLTVKNGKVVSSQLIGLIPSAMGGTITYDNSTLTFEGVEASTTATSGIEANGNNTNDTVVLKDSTLNVPNGFGIYFPSSGTLTIDNSTINAKTMGAQVCSGNLNVTAGSVITVSGDPVAKTEGDGAIQDGAAISIVNRAGYKGLGQIAIAGGTFTAKDDNAAIKAYTWDSATKQESAFDNFAKTVAVSGGTFSSAVASDLCAEGYAPVANADGTYSVGVPVAQVGGTVFTSLQAAIDAAQDGDTVQLLADAVVDDTVIVQDKGAITLDLDGKTISNTKEIWNEAVNNWSLVSARGNSDLTITGNGSIDALANDSYAIDLQDAASKCTIENGTFTGNVSAVYVVEGALTINGGTFDIKQMSGQGDRRFTINCYDSNYKNGTAQVSINGGTFNGFDPANNLAEGTGTAFTAPGYTTVANADGTYGVVAGVAQVAGKAFISLQAAIDAAQDGETVTLLTDAAEDVAIGKSITLDLGGKTLTNTNSGKATISVQGGTVTVKNGNVTGGTSYYNIEVTKGSNANLTLADVTATAGNTGSSMIDNYGTLTITSGTYTGGLDTVKNEPNAKLTISGGEFTLTKGASKGFTGVVFNYGALEISGGTFIQSDKSAPYGQAQVIHTDKSGSAVPSTVISGGAFKNLCTRSTAWAVRTTNAAVGATQVSGGTFNKSISESYCADGFIPTKNADGTYGVKKGYYVAQIGSKKYETLADAIRLATKGKTITLLTDVEQNTQLNINKDITLDLNGKTIKNTQDIWGDNANAILSITNGAKVTITGNGTIDAKENDCYTINVVKGDLTIENGTFYGNVSVVQVQEGTLSVKGGTFDLHQKWEGSSKYLFNCIDDAYANGSANVAISGGTFVGFDPSASPEGEGTSYLAPGYAPVANADGTYGVVAGVAQIGAKAYASLQAAIDAAQDGDTVQLLTDIVLDAQAGTESTLYPQFTISGKKLTLDMQGHKISYSEESRTKNYGKASLLTLSIDNGSDVTITGNGTIDTELGSNQAYGINILRGSNLTINNGTFYGAMTAVQVQKGGLVINDGTFLMAPTCKEQVPQYTMYIINCIDAAWKDGSATVSIKGGTFGHDYSNSPEGAGTSYLAPGYASVANGDDTYGVKLAEGAYLLQDYRSGDQASWTYPTKEGMAFAGWYKDAAFTTPCTASDVEGAAYAKFVPITNLLQFKGGSLRMDKGVPSESTYLRFGYTKAIPEGTTYIENGWYYKRLSAPTSGDRRLVAYNNALNNDGTITSNLVFNGVAKNYYTANFTEKAFVKYMTVDGTTVEAVEDAYHSRSVNEVADAILAHPMASKAEKDYATSIKSAIQ